MNKGRMFHWMLLIAGAFMVGSADTALGQLLYRSQIDQEFYGLNGYNVYGRSVVNRSQNPRYDNLGNYLLDGVRIFSWDEERKSSSNIDTDTDRFSKVYKTNTIDGSEYFRQYLNNLVVLNETTKNFSSRFIIGNEVRVLFSPLTLDMAAMNGVRWDTRFGNNSLTLVSSRADLPLWFSKESNLIAMGAVTDRLSPVLLMGGHYERQMGILNVAANYVNTYKALGTEARTLRASNLVGDVKDSMTGSLSGNLQETKYLVVKIEDGSKMDGDGPRIYDMYPVIAGKAYRDQLVCISTGNWDSDFLESLEDNGPAENFYENVWKLEPKRIPQYTKFYNEKSKTAGASHPSNYLLVRNSTSASVASFGSYNTPEDAGKDYLECNGKDYILFWFEVPSTVTDANGNSVAVEDVKFKALLGNDYKISISELYAYSSEASGLKARYFSVIKEAQGNVRDMSNFGWVDFKYGVQTANMLMGLRLSSNVKGFSLLAEFNKNFGFYQYPKTSAQKFRNDANAYYINVKKEIGKFTFGTELFNIDSDYSTEFESTDLSYKYLTESAGGSAWSDELLGYSVTNDNPSEKNTAGFDKTLNNTMVISTVDDNDDKDRYPDYHMYSSVRDRNGIFPGQDENGNERPDTNENENLMPDYSEPFFLFNVDPDEYSYGDDFNNNGIIDNREDDDKPDYPYELDTRGYHFFGKWGADQGIKYTLGVIDYRQVAEGGKTEVKYGKVEYKKFFPFFANVNAAAVVKKVNDTIDNNTFRIANELTSTLRDSLTYAYNTGMYYHGVMSEPYYDQLEYKDSYANTSYFEAKLFRIPNLTIGVKLKYDLNHQNETSYQGTNNIVQRGQVLRMEYRYYYHDLLIMPQMKFLSLKYTNSNGDQPTSHDQYFYPILRIEYPLTTKTTLKCGMQGFPGITMNDKTIIAPFNSLVRDLANPDLSYDQRDYVFMVTNNSAYNGYDFSLNMGYQFSWQHMNAEVRAPLDSSSKVFFLRLVVGMEPIS